MSYDQWKTASPYDDDPDVVEECYRLAKEVDAYIKVHAELSDLTLSLRILLESCRDTLNVTGEWIENEV